ncbi:ABC transporter substrate-binding protein [Curtobacterium sp. Leaf261]|uniref:ABC transporter substrate-binding protein n=1 Tax=Curtobacterium sp. Leaf261 TaxID=1736311 RepID=UPI0006F71698|nr:ABC transporter substrate-binding protein [Curtobacterium sp. Leaf261]KQO64658.1 peptide ABC transporter substrate-binding protein [Curtobacterium sp. Leaf261]
MRPTSPRRPKTLVAALAVATAGVLVLAGCSGASKDGGTGGDTGRDATVRVGLVLEPTSLDIRTQAGNALDQVLIDNVYQGLVGRTQSGGVRNVLASAHTVSDDGLTYTFTLQQGVSFQDGTKLTAADVVWSLDDFRKSSTYVDAGDLSSVSDITAPDDHTVVITLAKPDSDLLFTLTGRAGVVLEQGADNDMSDTANGTGPFDVTSWKQGDALTLGRNTDYWGTKAKVAKVVFRYITQPSTAVNAMANGDLDVETAVDGTLKGQLQGASGITLHTGKTTDKYTLAFNDQTAPFTDKRVRQAIRQAIDSKALIKAIGGAGVAQGGPIPALDPGYQDLTDIDAYDPASAKKLLAAAGAENLTLTLTYANIYPATIGDVLTSELAKVGITLRVKRVDFTTWLDQVFTKKDFELSMVNHTEARDFGNWANPEYYFGYDNPTVQQLYADSLATTDADQKAADLAKAAKIVSEDAAGEWLYTASTITAVRGGVTGFPTNSTTTRLNLANLAVTG